MSKVLDAQPAAPSPAPAIAAPPSVIPDTSHATDMDDMDPKERSKAIFDGRFPKRIEKTAKPAESPAATNPAAESPKKDASAETAPDSGHGDEDEPANETPAERRKRNRGLREELLRANERIKVYESQLAESRKSAPAAAKEDPKPQAVAESVNESLPDLDEYLESGKSAKQWQLDYGKAVREQARKDAQSIVEERFGKYSAEQKQTEAAKSIETRVKEAKVKYSDFEALVLKPESPVPASDVMIRDIQSRQDGMDIAYYLAKHPELSAKLAKLTAAGDAKSEARIEIEFDRIAEDIKAPPAAQAEAPAPKKLTSAPTPPKPVSGSGAATGDPLKKAYAEKDWDTVDRIRKEQKLAKRSA